MKYNQQVYDRLVNIVCNAFAFTIDRDDYDDIYRDELRDGTVPDYGTFVHLGKQFYNGELSPEKTGNYLTLVTRFQT